MKTTITITIVCLILFSTNYSNAQITTNALRNNEQSKFDFTKANAAYLTASNYVYNLNSSAYSSAKYSSSSNFVESVLLEIFGIYLGFGLLGATSLSTIISAAVISQKQHVKNKNAKIIGLSVTGAVTGAVLIAIPTALSLRDKKEKALRLKQQQNKF